MIIAAQHILHRIIHPHRHPTSKVLLLLSHVVDTQRLTYLCRKMSQLMHEAVQELPRITRHPDNHHTLPHRIVRVRQSRIHRLIRHTLICNAGILAPHAYTPKIIHNLVRIIGGLGKVSPHRPTIPLNVHPASPHLPASPANPSAFRTQSSSHTTAASPHHRLHPHRR